MRKRILRILGVALTAALIIGLLPALPAFALTGTINAPSPASGAPGTAVVVTGTGFTPNSQFSVWLGSFQVAQGIAVGGNVSASFAVPTYVPRGTYNITVTTSSADTSNSQPFTIIPAIALSASSGGVGDTITITGYGYSASNTITIVFDGVTQLTTSSSSAGSFSLSFTIPKATRGTHTITAYDNVFGASSSTSFTILAKVSVNPVSTAVGAPITLTGNGFTANSATTVYLDSTSITSTVTDATGGFTLSNFTLPSTTAGAHTLRAQDAGGVSQSTTITIISGMAVDPVTGPVGAQVNVSGNGFRANSAITLTLDNTALTNAGITTDSVGNFTAVVTIPATTAGTHQLKVSDGINTDTKTFTVTADAVISPTSGFAGTKVNVNGTGFLANTAITVIFDNTPVGTATSNAQGSFAFQFTSPARQAGTYKVRVTDALNTKELNFVVTTSATITPTSASSPGFVGQTVTVSGVGFKAGATLTVTYDGKQVTTGTVGSDSNFSVNFKAPVSEGGEHTVIVSDGTVTLELPRYFMDSTGPASPALVEPETGERQKAEGTFTWNSVSDPSGVTYELEIANSTSFGSGNIVLRKTDLTSTEYTLTKEEKLSPSKKEAPYFWRVRAIDGASNEGNWSNIWSFAVGTTFPAWALWTLIGLGALIIVLFAFWLGRRSSGSPVSTRIEE